MAGVSAVADPVVERAPGARSLSMLGNSVSLMLGKAAAMGMGFAFWVVAARTFEPAAVGLAGAAVSAMMLCTQLAIFGVGAAMIARVPRELPRPAALLDTAFTVVSAAAVAAALVFLLFASAVFSELSVVAASGAFAALFVAMAICGTLGILIDDVSIAIRRADQVLVRSLVFGGTTFALVAVAATVSAEGNARAIFAPWVVAGAASCALGLIQLRRTLGYGYRPRNPGRRAVELFRVGLPNYALTLMERAPGLILPIVVTELLSPAMNATWYIVWMTVWVLYFVPVSVGLSLFAEASHRPAELRPIAAQALRSALVIGVPAACALALVAPLVLGILGPTYAEDGAAPLRILAIGIVPMAFVHAYFGAARARGRCSGAIALAATTGAAAVAAAAVVGTTYGLVGMAVAWLTVQLAAGAWAALRLRALAADVA